MESVWLAEAPKFPGYYLAEEPVKRGKLGEVVEFGTWDALAARRFSTEVECRAYCDAHPWPAWEPREHGFC